MWLFDLFFLNSANLYVGVRISRGISEGPLDFEITGVDCMYKVKQSQRTIKYKSRSNKAVYIQIGRHWYLLVSNWVL